MRAAPSRASATRANSGTNSPAAAGERAQDRTRSLRRSGASSRARSGEALRGRAPRQPAAPPLGALGELPFVRRRPRRGRDSAGLLELRDAAVERRERGGARPSRSALRAKRGPRRGVPGALALAGSARLEGQGAARPGLSRRRSASNPSAIQSRNASAAWPGPGEGRRDAAGERAGDAMLAGELPDERGIGGGVGVQDLDLVERDPLLEDAAEHLADLVLFAARAEQAAPCAAILEPALRRRRAADDGGFHRRPSRGTRARRRSGPRRRRTGTGSAGTAAGRRSPSARRRTAAESMKRPFASSSS